VYGQDYIKQANLSVAVSIILFLMIILFGAASCILLLRITEKSITNPMKEIQEVMIDISKGNLAVNINYNSRDEIGVLCDAVRQTSNKLKNYITNITNIIKKMEDKDLTVRTDLDYEGDFKPIQISLDHITASLINMITVFRETSEQISANAEKIANASKEVAQGGMKQSKDVSSLVSEIDMIASKVNTIALKVADVYELSQNSVAVAEHGNSKMVSLVHAMQSIADHSDKIKNVIKVIHNIADQTNLLSLNASIEAARVVQPAEDLLW
jgi:methyl-accepting chemotaxis protein